MFKVGDLVECISQERQFTITDVGIICKVVEVNGLHSEIKLQPMEITNRYIRPYTETIKSAIAFKHSFWVPEQYFKKIKTKKTNRKR